MNSLKCPKSKSLSTASLNYSQSTKINIVPSGRLFRQPIVPLYYIEDCRISSWSPSPLFSKESLFLEIFHCISQSMRK